MAFLKKKSLGVSGIGEQDKEISFSGKIKKRVGLVTSEAARLPTTLGLWLSI